MSALDARELAVEAGGRTVLEGLTRPFGRATRSASSGATARGRRACEGPCRRGATGRRHVERRGALGYLRQDPRQHRADDEDTGLEHVLLGPGACARWPTGSRRPGSRWRSVQPRPTSLASRGWRSSIGLLAATRAKRRWKPIAAGLGLAAATGSTCRSRAVGGERRRLELTRILFAGSDLLLLDEPTNHLDVDAKAWLMKFLAGVQGRADRRQPRPRAARRLDHADPAPGPRRRRRVPGHLLRSTARRAPQDEERWPSSPSRQEPRSSV